MRFLADENFPLDSVRRLRDEGHDVLAAAESLPGSRDEAVLSLAAREGRVLLTFDRDYGELIYRRELPAPLGVVYLRFIPQGSQQPAEIVLGLEEIEDMRLDGLYTVVDPPKIRQRPLPSPGAEPPTGSTRGPS
jgi:predicted nuclease of predicted toxin-antitoxin system